MSPEEKSTAGMLLLLFGVTWVAYANQVIGEVAMIAGLLFLFWRAVPWMDKNGWLGRSP